MRWIESRGRLEASNFNSLVAAFLRRMKNYPEAMALLFMAALLMRGSDFALRCLAERHAMAHEVAVVRLQQQACLELRWRWEAEDQEHQYFGTSAGTRATVGPIGGYVMDVTENEFGHAVGQCHKESMTYEDLISQY